MNLLGGKEWTVYHIQKLHATQKNQEFLRYLKKWRDDQRQMPMFF
jgi:hypothetical protein